MRAWQISAFGIDSLEFAERSGREPGPGEVQIRIRAVSFNYRDLMMVKGFYNPKMKLPRIPCSDGAGEVTAVGEGVSAWKPGDRVAGIFMQNWADGPPTPAKTKGALGGDIDGVLAESVVLSEAGLVAVPAHLSFEEAATLPCAAVTAWNALATAGLKPGAHPGNRRRFHLCASICAIDGDASSGYFEQRREARARLPARASRRTELSPNAGMGSMGAGSNQW